MKNRVGIAFAQNDCHLAQWHSKKQIIIDIKHFDCEIENKTALNSLLLSIKSVLKKNTEVAISIPDEQAIIRDISIDATLSDSEIMYFLKSQSKALFGFSSDALEMDYQKLGSNIRVIAAHKHFISFLENTFLSQKIKINVISVNKIAWEQYQKLAPIFLKKESLADEFHAALGLCWLEK